MSTESPGGPPPPPNDPGQGPPPPPPPAPGGGPQSPPPGPGPQSGPPPGYSQPPPGYGQPGYGQPGYGAPPGGAIAGYGVMPQVLQGREFAGWWQRVGAYIIDAIVIVVGLIIFGYLLQAYLMGRDGEKNGQTLGKQALGIRVVREDGQKFDFGTALLREFVIKYLLFGVVGGFVIIGGLIDVLWPLWDERKQALHDKLASSYVVKG